MEEHTEALKRNTKSNLELAKAQKDYVAVRERKIQLYELEIAKHAASQQKSTLPKSRLPESPIDRFVNQDFAPKK